MARITRVFGSEKQSFWGAGKRGNYDAGGEGGAVCFLDSVRKISGKYFKIFFAPGIFFLKNFSGKFSVR